MKVLVVLLSFVASLCVAAPPTVYRCDSGGKVSYSDAPCVGGKVIDVTPTRGADKMTGRSIKGNDVQREEYRVMVDDASLALHGLSHEKLDVIRRRKKLFTEEQARCASFDRQTPALQTLAANAVGSAKRKADVELYEARKCGFDLKC